MTEAIKGWNANRVSIRGDASGVEKVSVGNEREISRTTEEERETGSYNPDEIEDGVH